MKHKLSDEARYKALLHICAAFRERLCRNETPELRASYEKYEAELAELRKKLRG